MVLIHLLFTVSGALGLVYEVLWMRRFTLLFGATAPAVAATLSVMFLGFAAGSRFLAPLWARTTRPLAAFGILEIGVALGAILAEPIHGLFDRLYPILYPTLAGHPGSFLAVKMALAMAAVLLPTAFMGATLPVLAQVATGTAARAGSLYAVNALGAAGGALAVPFVLLPALGAERSQALAIASSLCVGALAIGFGRRVTAVPPEAAPPAGQGRRDDRRIPAAVLHLLAFLSGALLLALEAFWTRAFALVHENSVYSFAVVVAVFLLGLSSGAGLARAFLRSGWSASRLLGGAWIAAGILVAVSPRLFLHLTAGMTAVPWGGKGLLPGLPVLPLALTVMLPATAFAGAALPLLMEIAGGPRAEGKPAAVVLGRLLASNTLGAIAGPLLGTFLLIPALGLWWSVALSGVALALAGEAVLNPCFLRRRAAGRRLAFYALCAAGLYFLRIGEVPRLRLSAEKGERVACLKEGAYGTVAVIEDARHRAIVLNNFYLLGGTASTGDERQQGHLPLLLHPHPARVAFLGMGTGITAGAALLHPVEKVVVVELVPEVVHAATDHFADANLGLAGDPRVEIRQEDARNYLAACGSTFDVIVGDLVVPWRPGESSLYAIEHYQRVRRALRPGGIFCQWLPLFQLSREQFQIALATFLDVFPRATLWRGDFLADQPALALVGHASSPPGTPEKAPDGPALDAGAADRRTRDLAARLDRLNPYLAHPAGLWLFLVGPLAAEDARPAGSRRNRDAEPWIELLLPPAPGGRVAPAHAFLGRALESFLEEVARRPLEGTPLANLDAEHRAWRDAGARLWHASLLALEGRTAEAQALGLETLGTLPEEIQTAVTGRRIKSPGGSPPPRG